MVLFFDFSCNSAINLLVVGTQTTVCERVITCQSHCKQLELQVSTSTHISNGIFSLFSHSSKGTNSTGYFKEKICFLPSNFFVMKNMTAIGLHFSSDVFDSTDGTGFMAGYATYVEGTISSDYHYNSCHKVTYTCRQAGF